jgi:hypothetical protein
MKSDSIEITPSTTVHALLAAYPELEDVLIGIAPVFEKLKNPLMRRSAARVATLQHIAAIGNIPLVELLNKIRAAVGQSAVSHPIVEQVVESSGQPEWFSLDKVALSVDFNKLEGGNEMPITLLLNEAKGLNTGEIVELVTTFLPAPGIELMQSKGYSAWVQEDEGGLVRSYFLKNND